MNSNRTVIEPQTSFSFRLREIWQYRELFYFFTWRDIKVRYKQTYLGVLWAVLQPLSLMFVFGYIFSKQFSDSSDRSSYYAFVLSGLVLWNLFYNATLHAAESITQQAGMIKKIYFPRLIIVGSSILTAFFDFIIALVVFFLLCILLKQSISWQAFFFLPAAILIILLAAFGAGTLLAALNVKYRDFRYALPFLLQFLFFCSQVVYPLRSITDPVFRMLLSLNPVNAAIEFFRFSLTGSWDLQVAITGLATTFLLTVSGLFYFRKTEAYFADIV